MFFASFSIKFAALSLIHARPNKSINCSFMKKRTLLILLTCFSYYSSQAQDEVPNYYIFSIYFGGGSYYIDGDQAKELSKFLEEIPNIEEHAISIHSYTDDIGGKEYNDWLSSMRSQSTLRQLLMNGIPSDIITIEDFGELNPIYDNSTWEGKLKNRRADVIIMPLPL